MELDRSKFLGGSDVAAVLGISPWKTPLELWKSKTTPREEEYKQCFERGKRWESVVAEMLVANLEEKGHKVEIISSNQRYEDHKHGFLACEIDYEIRLDDEEEITNAELKTVHPFKSKEWGDSDSDNMPIWYTAQVMHGLGVTVRKKGILAALFGADELRTYSVDADHETIAAIRSKCTHFWRENVLKGIPPEPININDLSILYPRNDEAKILHADENLTSYVLRLRAIDSEIKAREDEYKAIEYALKLEMKDSTHLMLTTGKTALEWKNRVGSCLDQEALKQEYPEIHKKLMKKWDSRVFTLKKFSVDGL